jgi:methylmalonyl-CoA/ethylmalonyl-CoA epimerase
VLEPRLHHVGYVVASISDSAPKFARSLGLRWDGQVIHDPMQFVKVTFLPANLSTESTIELVEPVGPRSPVRKFADAGGGFHHVCYEVDDLQAQIKHSQSTGATLVRVPLPAQAFGGRKIAWVLTSEKLLVEYLEQARD